MFLLRGKVRTDRPAIVDGLRDADLDSPQRSTIPLLSYWRDPTASYDALSRRLAFPATTPVTYSFEHPVGSYADRESRLART